MKNILFRKGLVFVITALLIHTVVFSLSEPVDAASEEDLQIVGVTDITSSSATVNIKDTSSLPLKVEFYYGLTDDEYDSIPATDEPQLVNPGETYGQVITGLNPETTYHWWVYAWQWTEHFVPGYSGFPYNNIYLEDLSFLNIIFSEIKVYKKDTSWVTVTSEHKTVDFLSLDLNHINETLGIAEIEAGNYLELWINTDKAIGVLKENGEYINLSIRWIIISCDILEIQYLFEYWKYGGTFITLEDGGGQPPTEGLVGFWSFDEGSGTVASDSVNANDGTIHGATWVTGKIGNALEFDGVDDYVNIPDDDSLSFGDGVSSDSPFSISAWVYMDSTNVEQRFVSKADSFNPADGEYLLTTDGAGRFGFFLTDESLGSYPFIGRRWSTSLLTNQWYYVVGTYDGSGSSSGIKLYVDGIHVDDMDDSKPYYEMENTNKPLYLGKYGDTYLDGIIDEVRIYNRALSESEIQDLYNQGGGNQPQQMIKPVDDSRGDVWVGADVGALQHFRGYWYHSYNPSNIPDKNRLNYEASPERDPKLDMLVFKGGVKADGVPVQPFHVRYPAGDATVGGVTYHNYQVYHEGIDISAGSKTLQFVIGDWVRTTTDLNVRTGPGLSYEPPLAIMSHRSVGQIVDGPADDVDGNDYVWWKVCYDDKEETTGWSAHVGLEHSIYGRDVYAAASGEVVQIVPWDHPTAGKYVWIYHGDIKKLDGTVAPMISTRYLHLDTIDEYIYVGMEITKGTKIGTVGNSGTYFHHLHFEVRQGDTEGLEHRNTWPLDPLDFVDYESVQREVGKIVAACPVDLIITDPDGLVISKETNELLLSAMYVEAKYGDLEEGPYDEDDVILYDLKLGDYLITVVPEPDADPTDTYSLEVYSGGIIIVLAENNQISNIPDYPYLIRSTETEIIQIIPTNIDIDPDTLNLNSTGKWITCYIELPNGYNPEDIVINSIILNDVVPTESKPINISDYDEDGISDLMIKFDRQAVIDILEIVCDVKIKITGELIDGTKFEGIDFIKVI